MRENGVNRFPYDRGFILPYNSGEEVTVEVIGFKEGDRFINADHTSSRYPQEMTIGVLSRHLDAKSYICSPSEKRDDVWYVVLNYPLSQEALIILEKNPN